MQDEYAIAVGNIVRLYVVKHPPEDSRIGLDNFGVYFEGALAPSRYDQVPIGMPERGMLRTEA